MTGKCNCCAWCCLHLVMVMPKHYDVKMWATFRGLRSYYMDNSLVVVVEHACPHLKDNKCDSYEFRPDICRKYPNIDLPFIKETLGPDCGFRKTGEIHETV